MTRFDHPKALGDVLSELVRKLGIREPLDEARAVDAWHEIAGPQIAAVTDSVWIRSGRMFVKITSPTWRHELSLQREEWRERINAQVGREIVKELLFR